MRRVPFALVSSLLIAACGQAPSEPQPARRADITLPQEMTIVEGVVPRNATLDTILREHGLAADAVQSVITAVRTAFDPRRLRSLQPFSLALSRDGVFSLFEYEIDADSFLRVRPDEAEEGGLRAEVLPIPKTLQHGAVSGDIDAETPSLFQSMLETGERAELAIELARVFSGEIDFNSELQPGDSYVVAFERFIREGRPESYGEITAAEFRNDGRVLKAIRFTPPGGEPGYYDENGRSLRRFFLKSPLKFDPRITSRFSLRRMHPVLRTARAHRGVDYAAPTGAEVVAVASGTVVSATYDNVNGRMVRLRHPSGYETYYLHLSAFGRGIRAGVRVDQGQVVGRVGATGLATGPHLHYGLKKNGVYVDPVAEHRRMPPGDPVPPAAMEAFEVERDRALEQLEAASRARTEAAVALASHEP